MKRILLAMVLVALLAGCGSAVKLDDVAVEEVVPDLEEALQRLLAAYPHEARRIFCTYTAMMRLRRLLATRYHLAEFGEESA